MKFCKNCILDDNISTVKLDINNICNYCNNFKKKINPLWVKKKNNKNFINQSIIQMKSFKKKYKNNYDCIIGVSGGIDSSYLTYLAVKKFKLKPLLVHVDAGWNSDIAIKNINSLCKKLDLDLKTIVVDWKAVKTLQLALFKASIPSLDIAQDHSFFSELYEFSNKVKIPHILTGYNFVTESLREPLEWAYHASDTKFIKSINKLYGSESFSKYPMTDLFKYKILYRLKNSQKKYDFLNYLNYNLNKAKKILQNEIGWLEYGHKHYESRLTKFIEGYWLVEKFNYDKKKFHFSSMILAKQLTRKAAFEEINKKPYTNIEIVNEKNYIADKLDISLNTLNNLLISNNKNNYNYNSNRILINIAVFISRLTGKEPRLLI